LEHSGQCRRLSGPVVPSLPGKRTEKLASVPTGLAAPPDKFQERLINWGYAMTDIAVRSYVDPKLPAATAFPYKIGVGA